MAMLVPELVISVAMTFENDGLSAAPSCKAPLFDPESLWRIPVNINLTSVPPPDRKITTADLAVLSARRAGGPIAAGLLQFLTKVHQPPDGDVPP
jgi:hypothetical protein